MQYFREKPTPLTMEQAVVKALEGINRESERLESFIYYRNRLAQMAVGEYWVTNNVGKHVIEDQYRADHYGVDVGTVFWLARALKPSTEARLLKRARKILRELK